MISSLIMIAIGADGYRFYCTKVCSGPGSTGCTCSRPNKDN